MSSDMWIYVGTMVVVAVSAVYFTTKKTPHNQDKAFEALQRSIQLEKAKSKLDSPKKKNSSPTHAKKSYPGGKVVVLFGSQTGTAESFAKTIAEGGEDFGFDAEAIDLEEFDAQTLHECPCVIFVMATYGEGDPTDNAVEFTKFINDKDQTFDENMMSKVKFTVFGLGNKQYEHYNSMGRLINKLMEKHGGNRIYDYGEGDDDANLEEDFENWRENLWPSLRKAIIGETAAPSLLKNNKTKAVTTTFKCVEISKPVNDDVRHYSDSEIHSSNKVFFTATPVKLIENRELRQSNAEGSTLHLELELKNTSVTYQTADNAAILSENDSELVASVAKSFQYKLNHYVTLQPKDSTKQSRHFFPTPCSIETILRCYLDLNSAPRKGQLMQLAHYATDTAEQDRLICLASKEGKDEYHSYILTSKRSFGDIFNDFPSIQVSLSDLIHIVPYLQPRYYTISSSSLMHPTKLHITLGVIQEQLPDNRLFKGVCSNYLANLSLLNNDRSSKKQRDSRPGEQGTFVARAWPSVKLAIRSSTFKLPKDPTLPILMIGPGTGIAPMRAFLQERQNQAANKSNESDIVGESILYFGCRNSKKDYIYADELQNYVDSKILTKLYVAFSRERTEKVYVQHLMVQNSHEIYELLKVKNGSMYVCGATNMGNDVHAAMLKIFKEEGQFSQDLAQHELEEMQKTGRYVQELWSS